MTLNYSYEDLCFLAILILNECFKNSLINKSDFKKNNNIKVVMIFITQFVTFIILTYFLANIFLIFKGQLNKLYTLYMEGSSTGSQGAPNGN